MSEPLPQNKEVDDFILQEIDTVPHLEALLLMLNSQPRPWTVEEMAAALYVSPYVTRTILQGLTRRRFLAAQGHSPESYIYQPESAPLDRIIRAVDIVYRTNLIRISRMIHAKGTASVREFAQAFRFKKERD